MMIDRHEILDMSLSLGTARRAMWGALAGSLLVLLGACSTASGGGVTSSSSPSPAHRSTVVVGVNPQDSALDPLTHTLYIESDPENGNLGTVTVLNASTCDSLRTSSCVSNTPYAQVGSGPVGIAVDQATDTIYVVNSNNNTVSVIDGATCNATMTSGCGKKPPSVTLGQGSVNYNVAFAIDQANRTLYVANWAGNTLSMIDKASCNAAVTSGCAQTPHVARVGRGPDGIAVNPATQTVYVPQRRRRHRIGAQRGHLQRDNIFRLQLGHD